MKARLLLLSTIMLCLSLAACKAARESKPESAVAPGQQNQQNGKLSLRLKEKLRVYSGQGLKYLSKQEEKDLAAKAERGDKNAAAMLFQYYRSDREKAAHYLNIAGRGGEGIGQYGIAYFEISPHLKKGEEPLKGGGYCRDQFILSDELVEMLEDKALRGNAKAAMRLYDFYRHFDEYPVKARAYLTLAAIFGEPRALQILYPVFPLPEGVKPLTFTIPPR